MIDGVARERSKHAWTASTNRSARYRSLLGGVPVRSTPHMYKESYTGRSRTRRRKAGRSVGCAADQKNEKSICSGGMCIDHRNLGENGGAQPVGRPLPEALSAIPRSCLVLPESMCSYLLLAGQFRRFFAGRRGLCWCSDRSSAPLPNGAASSC